MTLGERICARRTALGFSQDKLAEQLDVSRQSVSKWETDASVPDLDKLVKLSEIFGMTLDELVRGESGPQSAQESPAATVQPSEAQAAVQGGLRVCHVLGAALMACGVLGGILLMGMGWGLTGLILGVLLAAVGLAFLLPPVGRLACLWILWLLLVFLLIPALTGVNPRWIFSNVLYQLAASGQYPWKYYVLLAWAEVLTGAVLAVFTVRLLRRKGKHV